LKCPTQTELDSMSQDEKNILLMKLVGLWRGERCQPQEDEAQVESKAHDSSMSDEQVVRRFSPHKVPPEKKIIEANCMPSKEIAHPYWNNNNLQRSKTPEINEMTTVLWSLHPLMKAEVKETLRRCEEWVALNQQNYEGYILLAMLYFERDEVVKALMAYERAKSLNPALPEQLFEEVRHIDWSKVKKTAVPSDVEGEKKEIIFFGPECPAEVTRIPSMFVDDYPQKRFANHFLKPLKMTPFPVFCLSVPNARVVGFRTILTAENELCNGLLNSKPKQQSNWFNNLIQNNVPEGYLTIRKSPHRRGDSESNQSEERYLALTAKFTEVQVDEPVVFIGNAEPYNYGSWLLKGLPRLSVWERLNKQGIKNLKVLVYMERQWQKELLKLAGIDLDDVIHHDSKTIYRCKRLFVTSGRNNNFFADKETIAFYQRFLEKYGIVQKKEKLIYVSRLTQTRRVFINEQELVDELKKRDFLIFEPEQYPLLEQVRVFASAKLIVGPSGAGMFNCVFSPPGTTIIDIEAFPNWLAAHSCLFAGMGHRYGMIIGEADPEDPTPVHKRWRLDVGKAIERIDQVLLGLA
jgi:hypothetical protein